MTSECRRNRTVLYIRRNLVYGGSTSTHRNNRNVTIYNFFTITSYFKYNLDDALHFRVTSVTFNQLKRQIAFSFQFEYRSRVSWPDENGRKRKQLRRGIDNSRCRTENYLGQFSADLTSVLFHVRTLKLNTLAINLAFMRLSRGIEGSDGRGDAESGMSRERERKGRGWKLCTCTYIRRSGTGDVL